MVLIIWLTADMLMSQIMDHLRILMVCVLLLLMFSPFHNIQQGIAVLIGFIFRVASGVFNIKELGGVPLVSAVVMRVGLYGFEKVFQLPEKLLQNGFDGFVSLKGEVGQGLLGL